jgi:nucleoside-diphosphate-sugar epimerase
VTKKILIVGGTGFIGYHLALQSKKMSWDVTIASTKKPPQIRKIKKVKYIRCDISKKSRVNKAFKNNFNYVVNLGGYVDHGNKKKTFKSHYNGSKNLANYFLKKNIDAFVQIGSGGEYGKLKSPQRESSKSKPLSVYSRAKFLATNFFLELFSKKNFPVTILRLYQVYGPKQDQNRFLPIVIKNCLLDKNFPCSHGQQFRDFVYIKDVVNAIIKSLIIKKAKGEIINIGSQKPLKIKRLISQIIKITGGGKPQYGLIPLRKEENLNTHPSILKAKKIINWEPKINFKKGLKLTVKYYEKKLS